MEHLLGRGSEAKEGGAQKTSHVAAPPSPLPLPFPSHLAHPFLARVASVSPVLSILGDRSSRMIFTVLPDRSRPIGSGQAIHAATRASLRQSIYAQGTGRRVDRQRSDHSRPQRSSSSGEQSRAEHTAALTPRAPISHSLDFTHPGRQLGARDGARAGVQIVGVSCTHVSGFSTACIWNCAWK